MRTFGLLLLLVILLAGCEPQPGGIDVGALQQQVKETERAFARTMADRDFAAFREFLSPEAVFFSATEAQRGAQQVADAWQRFFEAEAAPFSWAPEQVVVLESGTLALSTGPVHDPAGKRVATFTSIWRLEGDGAWRVIFDKGCPACEGD
jgi:ketosteroid isomerase-like protein